MITKEEGFAILEKRLGSDMSVHHASQFYAVGKDRKLLLAVGDTLLEMLDRLPKEYKGDGIIICK